jgi:hypothetical protein
MGTFSLGSISKKEKGQLILSVPSFLFSSFFLLSQKSNKRETPAIIYIKKQLKERPKIIYIIKGLKELK